MLKKNPYLSIVTVVRNDNHGENMLERMQIFVNGLMEQLEKYRLESEYILVEWNPPADKPLLKQAVKWPSGLKYCTIRNIYVPLSIHRRYQYSDKLPMNVAVALNCGFRRARGEFILPAPIDLLYPDELMAFIGSKNLKKNERYRVSRYDVDKSIISYARQHNGLDELLEYCKKNIIKVHDFRPYGYEGLPDLHTDAAGDFQLMSRDYWRLIRGYREFDLGLLYIDGLFAYCSFAAGVKEIILEEPLRIYHIDHGSKTEDRVEVSRPGFDKFLSLFYKPLRPFLPRYVNIKLLSKYHRLIRHKSKTKAYGVPMLDYLEYLELAKDVVAGRRSYVLNDENWGLGQEKLPEFII